MANFNMFQSGSCNYVWDRQIGGMWVPIGHQIDFAFCRSDKAKFAITAQNGITSSALT